MLEYYPTTDLDQAFTMGNLRAINNQSEILGFHGTNVPIAIIAVMVVIAIYVRLLVSSSF